MTSMISPTDVGAMRAHFKAVLRNDPLTVDAQWLKRPETPADVPDADTHIRLRLGKVPSEGDFPSDASGMFEPVFTRFIRIIWHPVRGGELIFNQAGQLIAKRYQGAAHLRHVIKPGDIIKVADENFHVILVDSLVDRTSFQAVKVL